MRKLSILTLLASAACLLGCGNAGTGGGLSPASPQHVYISGYITTNGAVRASYWRDGVPVTLDATDSYSTANGIAVSGTDVYVAGSSSVNGGNHTVKLWRNGVATALTDGTQNTVASGIALAGSDVYVSGSVGALGNYDGHTATYWKNGVAVTLPSPSGSVDAGTYAIAVSGNDVFVAGYTQTASSAYPYLTTVATIWKNGVPTLLSDNSYPSMANALYLSGSDVYVAGYAPQAGTSNQQAVYWKNGIKVVLPSAQGSTTAQANAVLISGQDIYVSGLVYMSGAAGSSAGYWKNGSFVQVVGDSIGPLAVSGSTLYMAGANYPRYTNSGALDPATSAWIGATFYTNGVGAPLAATATTSGVSGIVLASQ